ncbi:hypothetical protein BGX33_004843 [Mortierella sp. NVP41]|nr:hypothetical protein BGX33_004843 [Mortierella sp. NVP41]
MMETYDGIIISQENASPQPPTVVNATLAVDHVPPVHEFIDEESAFSFRKKKPSTKAVRSSPSFKRHSSRLSSSPARPSSSKHNNDPLLSSPSLRATPRKSAAVTGPDDLFLNSKPSSVNFAAGESPHDSAVFSTPKKKSTNLSSQNDSSTQAPPTRWETIWKCSWIVPSLVPVSINTATTTIASTTTASRKSISGFPQKKSTSLSNQQSIFEGKGGIKVQATVAELPGIVFALPVTPTSPSLDELSLQESAASIRKESMEMHLVARIRICTFPIFLLAPGCTRPCRIFTSPDSQTSSQYLRDLLNDEDIAYMKEQSAAGVETAMGSIGLLLRVAPKQGQVGRKKSALTSNLKQEANPFMMPVALGPSGEDVKADSAGDKSGSQRRLFQETTMFLVYGALVKEMQRSGRLAEPIISFFAYPLVDQASLMDHMLLNTRSLARLKQDTEKAGMESGRTAEDFVSYDDPVVDSIMNGCDSEQESGYSSDRAIRGDMDLDDVDDSLQQEMELLQAIERNKSWAPYIVTSTTLPQPPPGPTSATTSSSSSATTTAMSMNHASTANLSLSFKEVRKERSLSRAQTLDNMATSKDTSSRSSSSSTSAFSRHRSMDGHTALGGGLTSARTGASTSNGTRPVRKGISRLKSPSRAPQQPLDVTTEGLRRKLLGPGSIRKTLASNNNGGGSENGVGGGSFSSMHVGMRSPSRRAAASASRGSSSPGFSDDIPDLMTMMKMKKRQNIERAAAATATGGGGGGGDVDRDESPFSVPTSTSASARSRTTKGESGRGGSSSSRNGGAVHSNPFLVTLKNIQNEEEQQQQQHQQQEEQDYEQDGAKEMFEVLPTKSAAATGLKAGSASQTAVASLSHSRSQPAPLPTASSLVGDSSTSSTSSKSIEARNQATIKGLMETVLSKNNIGPGHEEFEDCADHLYRTVTFAMRKDITTKVYHLEELERLMDRHASMM